MPPENRQRRVTSYDVAYAAGVSQSSVSRAFSSAASISPAQREKVLAAAHRLGYVPNAVARTLQQGRSNIIGLLIARPVAEQFPSLIHHLSDAIQSRDRHLLLFTSRGERDSGDVFRSMLAYPLDGIIATTGVAADDAARCRQRSIPLVSFSRPSDTDGVVTVGIDHADAAASLTRHLIARGRRRFVLLSGPRGWPVAEIRLGGMRAALSAAGLDPQAVRYGDYSYAFGHSEAAAIQAEGVACDALIAANDSMAMGAMDHLRYRAGVRVPQDVAVAGFDDLPSARQEAYRLTTCVQPLAELVDAAVAIAAKECPPRSVTLKATLRPGWSSGAGEPTPCKS